MKQAAAVYQHRQVWQDKASLRRIYQDYHRHMRAACGPGETLEIGGGSGRFQETATGVISIDIQFLPWLHAVADAHSLPFADQSFDNIVMLDVLHHLSRPLVFFGEIQRVLKPGGRLVLMEPAMTPISRTILSLFHQEPVDLTARPLDGSRQSGEAPEDANQAIPHLIFNRFSDQFADAFPRLVLVEKKYLSLWAYPLSGGFKPWSLLPGFLVRPVLELENILLPVLGSLAAFRLLVVLEKRP